MTITVHVEENPSIRLTDQRFEARPPDELSFRVEGNLTLSGTLLETFEGTALNPVSLGVAVDGSPDSRTVDIDLADETTLRLEAVDVGIATPDGDAVPTEPDDVVSDAEAGDVVPDAELAGDVATEAPDADASPAALSFTVDGSISAVPHSAVTAFADGSPRLVSLTFAVDDALRGDVGAGADVLAELSFFGYTVTVRRDGSIVVGAHENSTGKGLP
ncbi:hypothetical protein [Haloprofundus halobius]|uniref:hypothetical protein n=1 Tax=Haloprofundus halobius TaxID=2876194 RepID=UPI001CCD6B08|nr:hypothetical protein [Haloprofundus halobius]